ncbi:MAG: hypothetical protein ACR2RE_21245, partial [Geminicoccaceae bacterium]
MPNLLSIERVVLFGLIFRGFSKDGKIPDGDTQFAECGGGSIHPDSDIRQALKTEDGLDPRLARIYAISYEGHYTVLPRPTVFLVHGEGVDPEKLEHLPGGPDFRLNNPTTEPGTTGLPSKSSVFAGDIRAWVYDR